MRPTVAASDAPLRWHADLNNGQASLSFCEYPLIRHTSRAMARNVGGAAEGMDVTSTYQETLRAAFPAERIDGRAAFAQWGGSYPDARAYRSAIDGKTWEQLDRAYIIKRDDALGFLSTRELVQLLPVYLSSLVEEGLLSPVLEAVLVKLARPKSGALQARYDALLAALSPVQSAAIAAALQHIVDQDPDGSFGRDARAAKADVEGRVA